MRRENFSAASQRGGTRTGMDNQRLIALFLLGWVLFNFPMLSLFNRPATFLGIPSLYVYIFTAWALVIGLVAWIAERRS